MLSLLSILIATLSVNYTGSFEEGDWVTYTNFRYVTSVAMNQTIVYFGTTGGVIRYDRFAKEWLDPLTVTDGIPDPWIENIAYDPTSDRIWVSTRAGNAYYQLTFKNWYVGGEFPQDLARNDFHPDAFALLNTEFGYFYRDGYLQDLNMQEYRLTRGKEDDFYNLFVGTWGLGPVLINTRYRDLTLMPYGPYSGNITTIIDIGDEYWMGDGEGGISSGALSAYNIRTGKWRWYQPRFVDGLASAKLQDAAGDKKTVWLATEYGLVRHDKNNESFITFADHSPLPSVAVSSLATNSAWVFAGTNSGLGYIEKLSKGRHSGDEKVSNSTKSDDKHIDPDSLIPRNRLIGWRINDTEIIDNFLYLAADRGALRRPLDENTEFEFVNTPDGMLSTEILDIANHGDSLYFVTKYDIVIVNTETENHSVITDPSYQDKWRLRGIDTDGINIWAATNIGLWKYRLKDGYNRLFTMADGMISDDVRHIVLDGDHIWIATPRGLIRFAWNDPGRID